MRAIVVYESMYGNTHQVADAIGAGLGTAFDVSVVPVSQTGPDVLAGADLAVVGGPTHAHGITRAATRKAAVEAASKPVSGLKIEPTAIGPGCASGSARSTGTRSRRRRSTPGCAGRPR
jgi:menaquinone-dependent protoporphyrinogen IX oxidase